MIKLTIDNISYNAPTTNAIMMRVAKLWKKNALQMLRRQGHKATGALANSIKVEWDVNQNRDEWSIELTPNVAYWQYVDSGVDGVSKKYSRETFKFMNTNTKTFSFTNKKPPLSAIMGWLKVKGYQGRNAKGQFISDRSFGFLVQNAIFQRGLKPSYFISKTGNNILKKYSDPIASAVAEDVANIVASFI
ncbi:MAG: hypothetical protein Unbinned2250contig1000_15 [Prokaryotic dsDNA virus sp.]|nr:MAG: hypothetical protein Unbinned2250contig1000_15 [Prokaryotic dsDNA virus sp.]